MKKDLGGRPTVMTESTLEKLKECFFYGHTDAEACLLAGINEATLYNYQKAHPDFLEQNKYLNKILTLWHANLSMMLLIMAIKIWRSGMPKER